MLDWAQVPVFGVRPASDACVIRPSVYGLIEDDRGRLAVVRTPSGTFLPGGGIEAGETELDAVHRELLEECGFVARLGEWKVHAVELVYSESERTHFEKRSTFMKGVVAMSSAVASERDHELVWTRLESAEETLTHQSHRWAVTQWLGRSARR